MSKCYLERKDVKITIKMNNVYSLLFSFFLTFITSNIPLFSFLFPFPFHLSLLFPWLIKEIIKVIVGNKQITHRTFLHWRRKQYKLRCAYLRWFRVHLNVVFHSVLYFYFFFLFELLFWNNIPNNPSEQQYGNCFCFPFRQGDDVSDIYDSTGI